MSAATSSDAGWARRDRVRMNAIVLRPGLETGRHVHERQGPDGETQRVRQTSAGGA